MELYGGPSGGNIGGGIGFMEPVTNKPETGLGGIGSFGGTTSNPKPSSGFDLLDLDGFGTVQETPAQNSKNLVIPAIEDGSITVTFTCAKV